MSSEHRAKTRPVPGDLRDRARALLKERGPVSAAAAMGVSRITLLAVAAGADVLPGTLALLRESQAGRPATKGAA
jgi:hypothetical protein